LCGFFVFGAIVSSSVGQIANCLFRASFISRGLSVSSVGGEASFKKAEGIPCRPEASVCIIFLLDLGLSFRRDIESRGEEGGQE
jgi:hypothetical protein